MELSNVVKQKWFMPVALGVTGLSFIMFLKKQGSNQDPTLYQDYSAVPGEKAEAIQQSMYDLEDRLKQDQYAYVSGVSDSLSAISDQVKDIELKIKDPAFLNPAPIPAPVVDFSPVVSAINGLNPAPVVDKTPVRSVAVGNARTWDNLAKDLGVSISDLLTINPGLNYNTPVGGKMINLPVIDKPAASSPAPAPVKTQEVRSVAVGNARTWDNLAKDLGVSKQTLIALNPGLNANSKIGGKTINLPKK